jgi:hypothetical protein
LDAGSVPDVEAISFQDVWKNEARGSAGRRLGRIEADRMGRDRVPARVGAGRRALKLFTLTGARLDDGLVVLAAPGPALRVLPGSR